MARTSKKGSSSKKGSPSKKKGSKSPGAKAKKEEDPVDPEEEQEETMEETKEDAKDEEEEPKEPKKKEAKARAKKDDEESDEEKGGGKEDSKKEETKEEQAEEKNKKQKASEEKPKKKKAEKDPEPEEDKPKKKIKAEEEPAEEEEPKKKKAAQKEHKKDRKDKKEKHKKHKKKKKKKKAPEPLPEPKDLKPSKIGEYELRFGMLEVVLAAGENFEATDPKEKFLVGRIQEDVLFGCDKEAYLQVEWYDHFKGNVFEGRGLANLDFLPAGSLVCSITQWCKEGFSSGKDNLTVRNEAWSYAERKLKEQLDDNYQSDEESQFGDEAVFKRLKFIRKKSIDPGVKGRKPITIKSEPGVDGDDDDADSDEDATPKTSRKRKAGKKKAATSPKSSKKPKRGLIPRPDLPVVEDSFDQRTGKLDDFDGDIERASKEIFRCIQAEDWKVLQAAVKSDKIIFSMHYPRSVGLPITPLMFAMVDGNARATKILLEDAKDKTKNEKRARLQKCSLTKLGTGKISGKHANYNRRKIGASRGGREGNNALLYDASGDNYIIPLHLNFKGRLSLHDDALPVFMHKYKDELIDINLFRDFDEIPTDILDLAEASYSRTLFRNPMAIENILRGGQLNVAKRYIEQQLNMPYSANSFNFLHLESLGDTPVFKKKPFSKDFQSKSVAKLSSTETRFSPLACACINPKSAYLEALLTAAPEHANLCDSKDTSLVHYAAACAGPEPLQYLIKSHSLSKVGVDKRKETPIHYAARAARPKNIEVLLEETDSEQKKAMLNAKTTEGFAAIHYAVITQRCDGLETLRVLLEGGSDPNCLSSAGRNKVSPVHLAARTGNLEALKLLVKRGGNLGKVDKIGRSPLIHACLNGHAHIVSYLLVQGVCVETPDSSDNFPVHYAAAYGYDDCLQLLLDAGANPDVKNAWKTSPLSVAVQKGRHRVSSLLFKIPNVDVNFKDDEGKTLLFRLVEGFVAEKMLGEGATSEFAAEKKGKKKGGGSDDEEIAALRKEMPWALQKLLERKDVDLATTDSDDNNVLHLLCHQQYPQGGFGEKRAVALAKLILSRGKIDLDSTNADGMAPLLFAATKDNSSLLGFLIEQGASMGPSSVDDSGRNLCHLLFLSNECRGQLKLVEKKAGKEAFCAMMKAQDGMGFTPVHKAVQSMVSLPKNEKADSFLKTIKKIVDRFPELATVPVGPIGIFKDPGRLAELILGEVEEEENPGPRLYNDSDGDDDEYPHRSQSQATATILAEKDRTNPAEVCKALRSRDHVAPTTSDDFGKSLIHFICDCKAPKRTKELLEWIVPLSKNVIDTEGGTDNNAYTPLQQLLYKILPAPDLKTQDGARASNKDRLSCLNLVLESIELLLKHGAKDANKARTGAFDSFDDLRRHTDGGEAELTPANDAENMKALKRCANSIVGKEGKNESSARKEIVDLFEEAMRSRQLRLLAKDLASKTMPRPVSHHLADAIVPVPTSIWSKLTMNCGLDLTKCDAQGRSLLHVALKKENAELSRFLCKECPELVTKASNTGELPIHVVAKLDKAPLVKLLLEHLKDNDDEVNRGDKSGRTAFHFSVEKAAERTGEVLDPCEILFLKAGARLDIADHTNQRTPLHYCFLEKASVLDHFNFPHSLQHGTHDRVELASSLLAAEGASESVKMADKFGRTPLCYAAAYNSTVSSLLLVSKGANMFREDQDGNTPINVAVLRGHANYAITMLKSVGSNNLPKLVDVVDIKRVEKTADSGEKAIEVIQKDVHSIVWHAIRQNLRGLVYILLDTSFPLQQAAIDALSSGSFQLVRKLLTTSPPEVIRHVDPDSGRNLLHEVARVKRYSNSEWSTTLADILLSSEIPAADVTKDGQTALHIAASHGHLDLVRLLIKADKSAVEVSDSEGHVPLSRFMRALPQITLGEDKCLEMISLLTTGIDSIFKDKYNKVPRTNREERTIEYEGIDFRLGPSKETVMEEIEARRSAGAGKGREESMDKVEGHSTLLIQALRAEKYRVMQALVDKGAPVDSADSNGLAALHHAVLSNSTSAARLLLRNGANPNIESVDERSATPLIVASFQCGVNTGGLEMAKVLIRSGADVTKACKTTGATALHIACRENNCDFASLVLRGALHTAAKEKKGKAGMMKAKGKPKILLVRLGQDCALYPAKVEGDGLKLLVTGDQASLPLSCVSRTFDCDHLCLDSLAALLKLIAKTGRGKTFKSTEFPGWDENASDLFHDSDDEMDGEDIDFFHDSDDEMDGEDKKVPIVPPKEQDMVVVTGGAEVGLEGELVCIDGNDAIVKDSNEDFKIVDLTCLAKKGEEVPASQTEAQGHREDRRALEQHYGLESVLVGTKDENITKPLKEGALVIVQHRKPAEYASPNDIWMEGKVAAVHKNGTYDVDVYRSLPIKGAVRQQLRPWKSVTPITWPSKADKSNKPLKKLLDTKDKQGHTPLMATIKPVVFGSYERSKMIDILVEHGAKVDSASLALARPSSGFLKHIQQVSGNDEMETSDGNDDADMKESGSLYGLEAVPNKKFEQETKKALVKLEARGLLKRKHEPPPISPACELKAVGLRVLPAQKAEGGVPALYYDVVMTKVELSHYGHSENKYYKMQIVEDPNKKLFVLVNNWGQVGDHGGQKQETPFGSRDEAVAEFTKVFKAKSGNLWSDYVSATFEPKLGKYKPVKILASGFEKPKLPNLVEMIDDADGYPDVVRESKLPSDLVETMKAFVDPRAINGAANNLGLQQEKLPMGRLSIKTLLEAERKLDEVEEALQIVKQKTKQEEVKEKREAMEQVAILSSQFYEMLPTKEGDNALAPLGMRSLKEQRGNILNLKNLTVASQIVNVACIKGTETNPLDFAYSCLGATMGILPKDKPERIGIEQYFRNTCSNNDLVISQVYLLNRQDEVSNKDMLNHRLLWHGTNRANVMGIIKEGLRVAPPTAVQSGNAFGDGVYFADMVSKSWVYCRESFDSQGKEMPKAYLLLADVALGEQECVSEIDWFEKEIDESADSVWAVGYEGPDVDKDIVFATSGAVVPLGKVIRSPTFKPKAQWSQGWRSMDEKMNEAIETALASPETKYPVRIKTEHKSQPAEIVLERGPYSKAAKVLPVKVRKVSEKSSGDKKKRKGNEGKAIKSENGNEDSDNDEDEYAPTFREFDITRKEKAIGNHVHWNEFIVKNTKRINLRFLVEVTSRSWLENKARTGAKK